MSEERKRGRASGLEAAVVIPNVILLAAVIVFVVVRSPPKATPLVRTDQQTASRIDELEDALKRSPQTGTHALELARLYSRVGEFPWSVDALRAAELSGDRSRAFRMKLGLAYLELGKNLDGLRVLKAALLACGREGCPADLKAKLEIFTAVAERLVERRIDARKDQVAAAKVFKEVLKPVSLPEKAPSQPQPVGATPSSRPSAPSQPPAK